jgi:chemotaxis protein histidine kinase CheA
MDTVAPEPHWFSGQAQGYIAPAGLLVRSQNAPDQDWLRDIYAQASILSGAAEMLGLDAVAVLAGSIVDRVSDSLSAGEALSDRDYQELAATLAQIETHLNTPGGSDTPSPDDGASDAPHSLPDLPPELLEIFALEASEHNQAIQAGLEHLRHQPGDTASLSEMRRVTHTLKGAAASVGFARLAHMAHLMEEILERHLRPTFPDRQRGRLLFDTADVLGNLIEPDRAVPQDTLFESVDQQYAELLGDAYPRPPQVETPVDSAQAGETSPTARMENMLRLSLATMDALINRVGEIIINRSGRERRQLAICTRCSGLDRATAFATVVHNIDAQVKTTLPIQVGAQKFPTRP